MCAPISDHPPFCRILQDVHVGRLAGFAHSLWPVTLLLHVPHVAFHPTSEVYILLHVFLLLPGQAWNQRIVFAYSGKVESLVEIQGG